MSIPALSPAPALAADPRPLPLSVKLLYGVGEMPITVLMFLSGIFLLFFYKTVMGLPPVLAGLGLSASLALDAVLDPYIGFLSDRTRHCLGRRHVFMLPGALAMGVCFFLMFSPPQHLTQPVLFLWLLVCSITLRATSAVYRIPYLGLGAELSRDYDDRTSTMAILPALLSGRRRPVALSRLSAVGNGLRRHHDRGRVVQLFRHAGLSHVE